MNLIHIFVFILVALIAGIFSVPRWRGLTILVASVLAIFWLQPALPVRNLDFWLPVISIGLVFWTWSVTQPKSMGQNNPSQGSFIQPGFRQADWWVDWITGIIVIGTILALTLTRYISEACCLTPGRPPAIGQVLLFLSALSGLGILFYWLSLNNTLARKLLPSSLIVGLLILLIILKSPTVTKQASIWLRMLTGQSVSLAVASDLAWLGFSYLAFRLLHVLRDFQSGKLPAYRLSEFIDYTLFFPAAIAGPIDRSQRWISELREGKPVNSSERLQGGQRILIGVFKKFVLADSLALIALNSQNASQVQSTLWAWVLLYAFALRIYLDFSGYTDIAIGVGQLAGFHLPENFNKPYQKLNLTAFWNSWHMTLAQWFRAYVFNPLTRSLRSQKHIPAWGIILVSQAVTMLLIGLWHGITINFAIWGLWHGLGLFTHNRWAEWTRPQSDSLGDRPSLLKASRFGSWLITFNFVALGWVWFTLPTPDQAFHYFLTLIGR